MRAFFMKKRKQKACARSQKTLETIAKKQAAIILPYL